MLCLYGMVKRVNIHLGWVFAFLFQKQSYPKVKVLFIGPYLTRILRNAHNTLILEIPYKKLKENKTEIDRTCCYQSSKTYGRSLSPEGTLERGHEEEMGAVPGAGEGSSGSTFEQQVLAQLAAMQLTED
nr:hypothetical protein Itr_chr01CG15700 [Ipomoea trifida]